MDSVALLYTTFPKRSETFLQREASALIKMGVAVRFYSILGGGKSFEGVPIKRLGVGGILKAIGLGILYIFDGRRGVWGYFFPKRWRGWTNWGENLLGLAAGIVWAQELTKVSWRHAQWGTAPAMAAMVARSLGECLEGRKQRLLSKCDSTCGFTGGVPPVRKGMGAALAPIKFSMGLHAYDLFARGGDGWLNEKVICAEFITSSNRHAHEQVRARWPEKPAYWIRRGLPVPVELMEKKIGQPLKIITVGRLVAKKGLGRLLTVLQHFEHHGIDFDAEIIGEGPLKNKLQEAIVAMGLGARVTLTGWLNSEEVARRMGEADFLFFTGEVAASGDRDGFPNVIGEAFAAGCVVVARDVAGVSEGVADGVTGKLITQEIPLAWRAAVEELIKNPAEYAKLRAGAWAWVRENFDAATNAQKSVALWREAAAKNTPIE